MGQHEATVIVALIGAVSVIATGVLARITAKEAAKNEERRILLEERKAREEVKKETQETVTEAADAWQEIALKALNDLGEAEAELKTLRMKKEDADPEAKTDNR